MPGASKSNDVHGGRDKDVPSDVAAGLRRARAISAIRCSSGQAGIAVRSERTVIKRVTDHRQESNAETILGDGRRVDVY
jgi:hypothetical protein